MASLRASRSFPMNSSNAFRAVLPTKSARSEPLSIEFLTNHRLRSNGADKKCGWTYGESNPDLVHAMDAFYRYTIGPYASNPTKKCAEEKLVLFRRDCGRVFQTLREFSRLCPAALSICLRLACRLFVTCILRAILACAHTATLSCFFSGNTKLPAAAGYRTAIGGNFTRLVERGLLLTVYKCSTVGSAALLRKRLHDRVPCECTFFK